MVLTERAMFLYPDLARASQTPRFRPREERKYMIQSAMKSLPAKSTYSAPMLRHSFVNDCGRFSSERSVDGHASPDVDRSREGDWWLARPRAAVGRDVRTTGVQTSLARWRRLTCQSVTNRSGPAAVCGYALRGGGASDVGDEHRS